MIDIPQYHFPWSAICTVLTQVLLLGFYCAYLPLFLFPLGSDLVHQDVNSRYPAIRSVSRLSTQLWVNHTDSWTVLQSCDILSLCLQAVGGALSSTSSGGSKVAVDVSIAGLSFQVFTVTVFIGLAMEFAFRYIRAQRGAGRIEQGKTPLPNGFKVFVVFLTVAIVLILIRCAYRIDELSDGYNGPLIHNEPLFITLEGV